MSIVGIERALKLAYNKEYKKKHREQALEYKRIWTANKRAKMYAKGLTSTGTIRKGSPGYLSVKERNLLVRETPRIGNQHVSPKEALRVQRGPGRCYDCGIILKYAPNHNCQSVNITLRDSALIASGLI